jgi:branched-chain amino acid transport system substrate-binding protein
VLVALLAAAIGCSEDAPDDRAAPTTAPGCDAASIVECAPQDSTLGPLPDRPTRATGEPIRIGTINQETGPGGAFPELTLADEAAIAFINTELGGVDGRPLELSVCDTEFSPERSTSCAQRFVQEGVVAVVGGLDVFGDGIGVLERNGIPYVGGIPVSFASAQNPVSFQFSGGTWGAVVAAVFFAVEERRAERISIMYGDFGPIKDSAELGQQVGESLGADVRLIPFPVVTQDLLTPLTAANDGNPDAIVALTADTGCVPVFRGARDLRVEADVFFTGACASPKILRAAGEENVEGRYFNTEGLIPDEGESDPDLTLYNLVLDEYGEDLDAASSATVSFRAMMDLYLQMRELGGDGVTADALLEAFRSARDEPSFMGHPYTCDGRQISELPALCAPQQVIAQRQNGRLVGLTDWIDVPEIVSAS